MYRDEEGFWNGSGFELWCCDVDGIGLGFLRREGQ